MTNNLTDMIFDDNSYLDPCALIDLPKKHEIAFIELNRRYQIWNKSLKEI